MTLTRLVSAREEISLAEALDLWVDLTGVQPESAGSFTLGELGVRALHREVAEALELDSTETTGRMLLAYVVQSYLEDRSFTADQLLNRSGWVDEFMHKARRLTSFLRGDEVAGRGDDFAQSMLTALDRYGALTPATREMVEARGPHGDRGILAVLRRDAMRTLDQLSVHQFLDGEPAPADTRPVYGKHLYRWANINSMLRAMVSAPSGVTVNLIQDSSKPFGVYFVFAIRNGARLFVFTDQEQSPHPLAADLHPRPDKVLAARANRNWFPYDVAGLRFTEEGRAYIQTSVGTSLVEYQTAAVPIKPLADLRPPQVLWLVMMLDLILDRFWRQGFCALKLSYTGEMVKVATPLLEAAVTAGLRVLTSDRALLQGKPITSADVHTDALGPEVAGDMGDSRHRWLEERYLPQVREDAIEIISGDTQSMLLTASGALEPLESASGDVSSLTFYERRRLPTLEVFDPTQFGTAEELAADRLFVARSNYASQINAAALREYDARKDEVLGWVRERMLANLPRIETLLVTPEARAATQYTDDGDWWDRCTGVQYGDRVRELVLVKDAQAVQDGGGFYQLFGSRSIVFGHWPWKRSLPRCQYTGAVAQQVSAIVPETAEQLAWLCGVAVSELPDVLQHWTLLRKRMGNHLLDRVDPMLWKVDDPWSKHEFVMAVCLSARTVARLERQKREHGAVRVPFAA